MTSTRRASSLLSGDTSLTPFSDTILAGGGHLSSPFLVLLLERAGFVEDFLFVCFFGSVVMCSFLASLAPRLRYMRQKENPGN